MGLAAKILWNNLNIYLTGDSTVHSGGAAAHWAAHRMAARRRRCPPDSCHNETWLAVVQCSPWKMLCLEMERSTKLVEYVTVDKRSGYLTESLQILTWNSGKDLQICKVEGLLNFLLISTILVSEHNLFGSCRLGWQGNLYLVLFSFCGITSQNS